MKLTTAFKAAFDSLVRTYTPMILGAALGLLAVVLGVPVPDEVRELVAILIATVFSMLWYGIARVIEVAQGKASKLLTLGIVRTEPTYAVPGSHVPVAEPIDAQPIVHRHDGL